MPISRLERLQAWGGASSAVGYVYRPSTMDGLRAVMAQARQHGVSLGLRGAGYSYGDAPLNAERMLLDLSRMTRILEWHPGEGVITVEPGVTIEQLWRYVLGDGWWPPVVPGTMFPTIGGCLGMNVHGKNNWSRGTIGDNTLAFEALLPTGELINCSPSQNRELFYAMIGGLGLLGCFTRITLQMQPLHSGDLTVRSLTEPNIHALVERMEALKDGSEYVVGWVDGTTRGAGLGRGQIHTAEYLEPGADMQPNRTLHWSHQDLPDTFFGIVPKSVLWRFMRPFMNNLGVPFINRGRYWSARWQGDHTFRQSLAAFNFLLDYVPHWKRAYQPEGLVQFQCLLPAAESADGIHELIDMSQRAGLPTYLGVLKRHRPDRFVLSHSLDGFSMAMDFRVRRGNRARLAELFERMEHVVLARGGRFYFAKDSAVRRRTARAFLGDEALTEFGRIKQRCDPDGLLETNLARRVFPEWCASVGAPAEPEPAPEAVPAPAGSAGAG
jgi:FAD/FMN-containing dehydrogenase